MTDPSPSIAVRDVHFAYTATPVLRGLSFDLFPGAVTAIAGANGSGKSTLLELIADVRAPQNGAITRRGDVSLVLQRPDVPQTLPVTGRDTVAMGTWKRGRRMSSTDRSAAVERALRRVGMDALADRPLTTLSGGQRQRIFVAQGIARDPDILLLDEPSAGLDTASVARTQEILREEAARGATVVCVTHDDDAIGAADRVIRLEHGRVAAARAVADLR
ncbi:zinc ABC transporter ATP-binding protein AztA [Leucobacter tardus]|uniref:Metal ABC transporter ATP-binding protein n=1 Tax=Leucobacter tardus TaxID=501483 RepID=A0A939QIE6_9MICO|nr:metal ABC transporter ATP-binding protein [Leucobacter tardus]MBO2990638.1 metal ABC transporter ATP-binding protein [Leucobacter tardus]